MVSYVGDNYDKDVVGAKDAGMKALFLVRPQHGEHPLQQRKRKSSSAALEEEGDDGDDGGDGEEGVGDLLSRFPAADMASFDLRPTSLLRALLDWEERGKQ